MIPCLIHCVFPHRFLLITFHLPCLKHRIKKEWKAPCGFISDHVLIYDGEFSEMKMKFAILKGQAQFGMRRKLGNFAVKPFEMLTDAVFRVMK